MSSLARWRRIDRALDRAAAADAKAAGCTGPGPHGGRLTFHHVRPASKRDDVATTVYRARPVEVVREEIGKCVVLCEACHRRAHGR